MKKLTLCLIALLALQSCATVNQQRTTRTHTKKAAPKTAPHKVLATLLLRKPKTSFLFFILILPYV